MHRKYYSLVWLCTKTIVGCGFCDIQNNQGQGKGSQPKPNAEAYNSYLDLDIWISQKPKFIIQLFYYTLNEKNGSHVFASSLMGSKTKGANLA